MSPFEYETEILEITSGSSVEYFRSLNPDVFSYQISLNADILDSAENIEKYSLALMGAVEILWKNADKRNGKPDPTYGFTQPENSYPKIILVFTPTPLDDYVWREDDTYSWFNVEGRAHRTAKSRLDSRVRMRIRSSSPNKIWQKRTSTVGHMF